MTNRRTVKFACSFMRCFTWNVRYFALGDLVVSRRYNLDGERLPRYNRLPVCVQFHVKRARICIQMLFNRFLLWLRMFVGYFWRISFRLIAAAHKHKKEKNLYFNKNRSCYFNPQKMRKRRFLNRSILPVATSGFIAIYETDESNWVIRWSATPFAKQNIHLLLQTDVL